MTLSTLFGVVLTAVGRDPAAASLAPDDSTRIDEPGGPASAERGAVRGVNVVRTAAMARARGLFAMALPPRAPSR